MSELHRRNLQGGHLQMPHRLRKDRRELQRVRSWHRVREGATRLFRVLVWSILRCRGQKQLREVRRWHLSKRKRRYKLRSLPRWQLYGKVGADIVQGLRRRIQSEPKSNRVHRQSV